MSSSKDFYVVLPSNVRSSSSEEARNTPSNYLTELETPIELESESDKWEVALVEISFVNSLKTIDKESLTVVQQRSATAFNYELYKFSPPIEAKAKKLVLNEYEFNAIELNDGSILRMGPVLFRYNLSEQRFTLETTSPRFKRYIIGNTLASIMGFHPRVYHVDWITRILYPSNEITKYPGSIQSENKVWKAPYRPAVTIHGGKHYLVISGSSAGSPQLFTDANRQPLKTIRIPTYATVNHSYTIPPGYYETPQELVLLINERTDLKKQTQISLSYDEKNNRFKWNNIRRNLKLHLLNGLNSILGFTETVLSTTAVADHPPNLHMGISTLYVNCDVCSEMFVGNSLKPLLRNVNMPSAQSGETIDILFNNPMYVPCMKHYIDTIEIQIYDDSGRGVTVPLTDGKTVITLHFRKRV